MAEAVKTKWLGLWHNREGVYSGYTIKKADIPAYSRLIVRYNKYYEKDSTRPRFVYCFAAGDAANAITVERTKEDLYCFSRDGLQRLINCVACDVGGSGEYGEHIVEDYIDAPGRYE